MLEIQAVSKRFSSGNFGIKDLSLEIPGGVLGLLGANGAGKSTLMSMLATITKPTTGNIVFQGIDILKTPDKIRGRLGYLPQNFGIYNNLTAFEFLSYFAALKGVFGKASVMSMLELVNLHAAANRATGGFSGGMLQRLGIAQALINNPDLIIVDEPTAGLDPEERVRFRNILSDIGFDKLVIFSTHIVSDIEAIATHIAIIKEGRLVIAAPPEDLLEATKGKVWEATIELEQYDRSRTELKFSNAVRKSNGVYVRVVDSQKPFSHATNTAPGLEDAFLFFVNSKPS